MVICSAQINSRRTKMKKTDNENLIFASGTFLCEAFPADFHTWEEEKLDKYIKDNIWEPFEYYSANQVYDLIDTLATHVAMYMEEK